MATDVVLISLQSPVYSLFLLFNYTITTGTWKEMGRDNTYNAYRNNHGGGFTYHPDHDIGECGDPEYGHTEGHHEPLVPPKIRNRLKMARQLSFCLYGTS